MMGRSHRFEKRGPQTRKMASNPHSAQFTPGPWFQDKQDPLHTVVGPAPRTVIGRSKMTATAVAASATSAPNPQRNGRPNRPGAGWRDLRARSSISTRSLRSRSSLCIASSLRNKIETMAADQDMAPLTDRKLVQCRRRPRHRRLAAERCTGAARDESLGGPHSDGMNAHSARAVLSRGDSLPNDSIVQGITSTLPLRRCARLTPAVTWADGCVVVVKRKRRRDAGVVFHRAAALRIAVIGDIGAAEFDSIIAARLQLESGLGQLRGAAGNQKAK